MIRWGLAGTGAISRQIVEDFARVDEAAVVAVSSRNEATAAAFGDEFGIANRFNDYAAMLDSPIDAVYIGTPHVTHFAMARDALIRGRHVLCEKPLGLDATEVRQLTDIARSSGVFLMEAMWMKFNPLMAALAETISAGEIGSVRAVRASFGAPFPRDDSSRWKPGGSALLDQGIYPVTLSHMLLGVPERIHARGTVRPDGVDLNEHFTLEYADGRFTHGASSMVEFLDTTAAVSGDRGWIGIDPGFWFASAFTLHTYTATGPKERTYQVTREGHGYVPMLRSVTQAIALGSTEHQLHTLEDTALIFDTMDLIRQQISAS
jgi:predicted dehydrogenase